MQVIGIIIYFLFLEVNTMKSTKKLASVILAVVILTMTLCVPAMACNYGDESALTDIRVACAERIAQTANETILNLVERAQSQRHPNIALLVRRTNAISAAAIQVISLLGVEAECVYTTYIIGGVEVDIDPIIIIKREFGG